MTLGVGCENPRMKMRSVILLVSLCASGTLVLQAAEQPSPGSFDALDRGLHENDMFVRERALRGLAAFREPRCVAPILGVLKKDAEAQLREDAAYELRTYDYSDVREALLESLKDVDRVAVSAAFALGYLHEERAIQPTYRLVLKLSDFRLRDIALDGLRQQRSREKIPLLIDLMSTLPKIDETWGTQMASKLDGDLVTFAGKTADRLGPTPDTIEQWQVWWEKASALFDSNMVLLATAPSQRTYTPTDFADDPAKLLLQVSVDAQAYRVADPIRVDIVFTNTSAKPFDVVFPHAPSGWHPTMGWVI